MDTITPNLLQVDTPNRNFTGINAGAQVRYIIPEKIVLFSGHAYVEVPPTASHFKHLVTEDATDAQRVIAQLLNVYRKIPAVIIYKYGSNYERDLRQWEQYFTSHPILRSIPFFLYTNEPSDALRAVVKQYTFVDEIITRECVQHLDSKVNFLSKFKRMHSLADVTAAANRNNRPRYNGNVWSRMLKRAFDISVSSVALVAASPLMLVIAALIKLESRGPVFYASPRAGTNYRVFKFYKFRTMVANADKQLHQLKHLNQYNSNDKGPVFYKVSNDPRVTRLGAFLRNTSLDEIPQLFNVLKGDMSLVGNRPLPLYEAATLTTDNYVERFLAPAGITGLWQISKRGKKEMSVEERINLDIDYAHKHSFAYDIWLMLNTPFALIQKDNV